QLKTLSLGTEDGLKSLAAATGAVGGIIGSPLKSATALFGQTIPSYGVLFQAMQTDGSTNIRSTPSVIAADNDEAKFKVGITIPSRRGPQVAQLANQIVPAENIDTKPLTLDMNIKPHISAGDMVNLEIKFGSEDLAGQTDIGPMWNTRQIETRALVRD